MRARRPGCTGFSTSTACETGRHCSFPTTRAWSTARAISSPTPRPGTRRTSRRLAVDGGFNGIALQVGLAEKFYWDYAGEVPLILKLNGKTDIPADDRALSPLHATVEEAVRLGADAVGYTLYVGTPAAEADFAQYRQVRADARRLGMPLIVWAYPRGAAIESKGGKDSLYAVDYAARTASELGADVVKVNFPHPDKRAAVPRAYDAEFSSQHAIDAVVRSANRTRLLVSGGAQADDETMLDKARQSMEAGATGLIWGATSGSGAPRIARVHRQAPGDPRQVPTARGTGVTRFSIASRITTTVNWRRLAAQQSSAPCRLRRARARLGVVRQLGAARRSGGRGRGAALRRSRPPRRGAPRGGRRTGRLSGSPGPWRCPPQTQDVRLYMACVSSLRR